MLWRNILPFILLCAVCGVAGFLIGMGYGPMPDNPKPLINTLLVILLLLVIAVAVSTIYAEVKELDRT